MRLARVLVLCNGAAGAEKQALALSARLRALLQLPVSAELCVRATPTRLARALPPVVHIAAAAVTGDPLFGYEVSGAQRRQLLQSKDDLVKTKAERRRPLDVVVGCGRTTVALCAALKRAAPRDVFAVQIQHPRVPLAWFDAVVAPRHDFSAHVKRPVQLHLTTGTVHDVSRAQLARAAELWRTRLGDFVNHRRVRVAWLVGGPCRGFALSPEDARAMAREFVTVLRSTAVAGEGCDGPAVFVTFSRRTPTKVVEIIERELRGGFAGDRQLFVWDGEGENPYHAFLALSTLVVTTPDSISMTTEAIASAKPVFTVSVERAQGKFRRFHEALFAAGFSAPLTAATVTLALAETSEILSASSRSMAPHDALEQELSAIASTLAQQISDILDSK